MPNMSRRQPYFLFILHLASVLLLLTVADGVLETDTTVESKVYFVYMGKRPHDNVKLITSTHHEILTGVLGSREASAESMIYSYRHGFSGFAAKLTKSQAEQIAESPRVVQVIPNHFYNLQTTRSWDYLGLTFQAGSNLLHETNMGDGTIIGVIDTGIWPESESFSDVGLGAIPSKWKGKCESGPLFDPAKHCNKKLIGARYFVKGFMAEYERLNNASAEISDQLSPVDTNGHGTHTASTAAGSSVFNVSYFGLGFGTARGGAPRARLAIYKACWIGEVPCADVDVLKAIDIAIRDGVDVLSLSLGLDIPLSPEFDRSNAINFASLHAVEKGIVVVCAGGNSGPIPQTVTNTAPWILTVAASTIDRSFPTPIVLGNNQSLMGEALFTGNDTGFNPLVYPEVSPLQLPRYCDNLTPNDSWITGNVLLCFFVNGKDEALLEAMAIVKLVGGVGIIVAKNPSKVLDLFLNDFPCIQVSYDVGTEILNYIRSSRNPLVRLRPSKTYLGKPLSTKVAYFSSRGPNSLAPAILKPDIAAPGVNILAAFSPVSVGSAYLFLSGTSMAAPHMAGIVALLKSLHPEWSPAAIKSAIVTTAWTTDSSGGPIFAEGEPTKLADPFDVGGGVVNPNKARYPGLVFDMGMADYIYYLCAMGYNKTSINQLTLQATFCPGKELSIFDVNLPSITIPNLSNSITLTRVVTNVGPENSKYKAKIEPPHGTTLELNPDILVFNSKVKKISFTITITTNQKVNTGYCFGSLTWTDGRHEVRIPISVRTEFQEISAY